jgi:AcrR family transcriptional regulator
MPGDGSVRSVGGWHYPAAVTDAPEPALRPGRSGQPAEGRELRARGKRTVRRLLEAGIEVFADRGYHAARVDDIVRQARTSHGTFYLYFANKQDLFRAIALDVAEEMRAITDELGAVEPTERGLRELRDWVARFVDLGDRYGPVIRAWTEAEVGTSDVGRLGTELLADVAGTLGTRIRKAGPAGLDPAIASMALVAMVERFNYYVLSGQVDASREQVVDLLAEVAYAGLFGAPVPRLRTARRRSV